jgi:biotin synthase
MHLFLRKLVDRIKDGGEIKRDEAIKLLNTSREDLLYLFQAALSVRRFFNGEKVFICGIVNAKSGSCSEDCSFCSQSSLHKTTINRHSLLSLEELLERAEDSYKNSNRCVGFVTSGASLNDREFSRILEAVKILKAKGRIVCASLGVLGKERAAALKKAGLLRYNHNLETSPGHFPAICTSHKFQDRLTTVSILKTAGIQVCSGGIWGVGESPEERIELAFILKELEVDSLPVNILNPIPGTKIFGKQLPLKPLEILKMIAIYRLILPRVELKICGGRELNLRSLQPLIFLSGANGFIAGNYLTTSGQAADKDYEMIEDLELEK